jgi:outer membrane protein assembly factor BamB
MPHALRALVGVVLLVLAVGGARAAGPAAPMLGWTSEAGGAQLTNEAGYSLAGRADVAALGLAWQQQLAGGVVASPLALGNRVFVATELGLVAALDAATGTEVWADWLGTQPAGPCGTWGISSTGAIDATHGVLYVANADGLVHALDIATGAEEPGWPVRVTARPEVEYVWGGVRIVAGRLYVPIASYCDAPDAAGRYADGRVVALDLPGGARAAVWDTVPGPDDMGGVWGFGGVSAEPDETALYTAVGNSTVLDPHCNCYVDDAGFGDSIVRLTRDLVPTASNRPANVPTVDDYDFGAAPLLFQPRGCPPLAAANNKDTYLYVWDRTHLERGPVYQTTVESGPAPFVGAPSWSARLSLLYDSGAKILLGGQVASGGVTAFRVGPRCTFIPIWRRAFGSGTQPAPVVLGDVLFAAGGDAGGYAAIDARSGALLRTFATGGASTLAPPIAVGRRIVTADFDGVVRVYAPFSLRR